MRATAREAPVPGAVEPLRPGDLTMLATDVGPVPMNIAAVLLVAGGDDGTADVPEAVVARAATVPRLVQMLRRPRRGAAQWVVDAGADPARHLACRHLAGGGERAVLDEAARLLSTTLDPSHPLWTALRLTGWDVSGARRGALVVVCHHVLADGIGGLGVLAALADDEPTAPAAPHPPAAPPPSGPRAWWAGLRELGLGARLPRRAARTSLNRPTGPDRSVAALGVPLAAFHAGAHRLGGTVNDAVVATVVGALTALLADRGEHPGALVVSVPVTGRAAGDRRAGNDNGVLPVQVPTGPDLGGRVRHVAAATARRKAGPRGHSSLPLGGAFRALSRAGAFRAFLERQRLVHTFETNMRGPAARMRVAGREVVAVVPAAANPGNVAASFAVLSYAGELVVAVVTDPEVVPDAGELAGHLAAELAAVAGVPVRVW